jgi:hypothetical protein
MKYPIKIVIFIAGGLLLCNSVKAADWISVHQDDEFSMYIDRASITKKKNIIEFWVKVEYKKIQTFDFDGTKYASTKNYSLIDCIKKTSGIKNTIWYNSEGKPVHSYDFPPKLSPIPPDSVIEFIFELLCR